MAVLTVTPITRLGVDAPVAASVGGDLLPNTGREFIEVINGSGSAVTVTINGYVDGVSVAIQTVNVPATTGRRKIGPFPPGTYNNASNQVAIGYSAVTTVTVAAYTLG